MDPNEENNKRIEEEKENLIKKKKKILKISIIAGVTVFILFALSIGFALANINNNKTMSNIKVNGIEIGKLSKEEIEKRIYEVTDKLANKEVILTLKDNEEFEYKFNLAQIEVKYKTNEAIQKALNIGRDSNIFVNNFNIVRTLFKETNIDLEYEYNEELLKGIIDDAASKLPEAVVETSYKREDDKLIITKGQKGNSLDEKEVKEKILENVLNGENKIEINKIEKEPDKIDIQKIHDEIYTEPKDAYYIKEPFQVFPHVDGIDFDIEEAQKIIEEEKDEYIINLKITSPKIKITDIGDSAFPDLLSTFTTKYDASNRPRSKNLTLAMKGINGTVVNPGEIFSYNKTLGERTRAKGYEEAGGFAGGKVVQTLAGGICQISSTLYDAAVYANLEIIERHNHMFQAGYVGPGKDATVVYGSLDFKFKNTRKYPIIIKTSIGSGIAKVDIFGIKEEVEYDVEIVTNVSNYTNYRTVYETDNSLAPGTQRVTQNGLNGCKSTTYKVLKLNGVEVSRTVLSNDEYDPLSKIIKKGPEASAPVEEPAVEETVSEEPVAPATPAETETPATPVLPEEPSVQPEE